MDREFNRGETAFSDELRVASKRHRSNFHLPYLLEGVDTGARPEEAKVGELDADGFRHIVISSLGGLISESITKNIVDAYEEEKKKEKRFDKLYWKTIRLREKSRPRSK